MNTLAALRRHRAAPLVLIFLLLAAISGGYALATAAPAQAEEVTSDQMVIEGQKLFAANCATCHGLGAEGLAGIAPSLLDVGAAAVEFQVATGRMPAVNVAQQVPAKDVQFSQEEILAMAAYVASLGEGPAIPAPSQYEGEGDPANGALLFRTNCAMCHGSVGGGGALTQGKYAPNLWTTEPIHIYEAMITGPSNMPVFNDANITPDGKRDIIAFLEAQRDGSPGGIGFGAIGPVGEATWLWIVGLGLIVATTVWIGARSS